MSELLVQLLRLLSDGELHSGADIGATLGVSRTAIWKHLQRLSSMGLSAESIKGKGYRLVGGLDLLDKEKIQQGLTGLSLSRLACIDVLMETESTNSVAMVYSLPASKAYVCLAEYQYSGRGRRGRQWISPFGHNIYLSIAWQFEECAAQLEGLSLAVGVMIVKVLEGAGFRGAELKWPNDILLQGRKLGGVLLEMSGDPSGVCQVVIGIGLNVRMPANTVIDQPWASVAEQLTDVSKSELVAGLLNKLLCLLSNFHQVGFAAYRNDWEALDAYRDKRVCVTSGERVLEGVASGVFDNGALRLRVNGEEQAIYGGEVSLRLSDDT
jgi:BirA family transcriptional regulator, biotin operon repressor / biotin---[acetyl-CoA-carboxylase] ligase